MTPIPRVLPVKVRQLARKMRSIAGSGEVVSAAAAAIETTTSMFERMWHFRQCSTVVDHADTRAKDFRTLLILEQAGLITVRRRRGQSPVIVIVEERDPQLESECVLQSMRQWRQDQEAAGQVPVTEAELVVPPPFPHRDIPTAFPQLS